MKKQRLNPLLIILILFLSIFVSSCESLGAMLDSAKPRARLEKVEVTRLSFDNIDLEFTVEVENPNPVGIRLGGLDYDFQIEGASLLQGVFNEGIEIGPRGSYAVVIPVGLEFRQLYASFESLKNKTEVEYALDIGAGVDIPGYGELRIPLRHEGKLPIPRVPEIRLERIVVNRIGINGIELALQLEVNNPNSFGFGLGNFEYSLQVAGRNWISGGQGPAFSLSAGGENILELGVNLNVFEIGRSVIDLLQRSSSLEYHIELQSEFNPDIPFMNPRQLQLSREGQVPILK